tara:strand:+ start:499 stop:696 length:198 start_codon:yes stop_codon:yes gene_type:complete
VKNNIIHLKTHPVYIKKMIKGKTLNLFGAPIPEDTIILHYEIFEKYFITEKQSTGNLRSVDSDPQ